MRSLSLGAVFTPYTKESPFQRGGSIPEARVTPDTKITEAQIATLVDRFYAKVRLDPRIGPVFNQTISDWPAHLALLKNFWSTILLTTGRYKGDPMMTHLQLPLVEAHFARWLELFEETAAEVLPANLAAQITNKAHRIAANFKAGRALQQEKLSAR